MAARSVIAWVLNLDADEELAAGSGYTAKKTVLEAMSRHAEGLARSLLAPGDIVVNATSALGCARGSIGRAFCPTPRALAVLARAGATPEPHPSFEVLRHVNSRAFSSSLGETLPGGAFMSDPEVALARLREDPPVGSAWRVKRAFGMTGRGQRVVSRGAVTTADEAFVRACVAEAGVQIEPQVEIEAEYAMHGFLRAKGPVAIGGLVRQRCDARGAWLASEAVEDETSGDVAEVTSGLRAEMQRVAAALLEARYFGPFGVDAFTYRSGQKTAFQPRSEINARYSMGYAATSIISPATPQRPTEPPG